MYDEDELIQEINTQNNSLNKCITEWYKQNFPENLNDDKLNEYKGCCNKDEINLLVKCYSIFSNKDKPEKVKKNKKQSLEQSLDQSLDKDFIRALIAYYYHIVVLENYTFNFIDNKYLKIDKIYKITDYITDIPENRSVIKKINGLDIRVNKDTMLLKDDQSNWYNFVLYPTDKDKEYIVIHNIKDTANNIYNPYVILKKKGLLEQGLLEQQLDKDINEKYIYQKQAESGYQKQAENGILLINKINLIKVLAREHLPCFDNYHTDKSKEYFELFSKIPSNPERPIKKIKWISDIRRIILGMNEEPFEGHKGGKRKNVKKYTKKNKKTFTPFRIFDTKSNRSNPFISARFAGILNKNWCKKTIKKRG